MADISIQFHSLPSELAPFIKKCASEMHLHIIGISFQPFSARELVGKEIDNVVLDASCTRFLFAETLPSFPIASVHDIADAIPGGLYLDVGKIDFESLGESWLACRTGNDPMNPKWKKIASWLRGNTTAGAVAVSPLTGASSQLRNHRYSAGAKELYDRGFQIRPAAGNSLLQLGS